jgi:hypothetical protein
VTSEDLRNEESSYIGRRIRDVSPQKAIGKTDRFVEPDCDEKERNSMTFEFETI